MLSSFLTYATLALLLSLSAVNAGPGANVFACLNTLHSSPPYTFPLDISFTLPEPECMHPKGHPATITATEPGQICTKIGYVEAKRSGNCWFGTSIWKLAYETSNGTSGQTLTKWSFGAIFPGEEGRKRGKQNEMKFMLGDDVMACPTTEACEATGRGRRGAVWNPGTQGPIYIAFDA